MRQGFRIGTGFDVHRLVPGGPLVLGGVEVPSEVEALGHSDADVVCHALIDAIFGALADGDIGSHFPDSDPKHKDISSLELLKRTVERMNESGCAIVNADTTIILQNPKVAVWRDRMRSALAEVLEIEIDQLSVKATTTEGLGLTGRGEGVAAQAIVLLEATNG